GGGGRAPAGGPAGARGRGPPLGRRGGPPVVRAHPRARRGGARRAPRGGARRPARGGGRRGVTAQPEIRDEVQLVTFRVGPQEFALQILEVERILRYQRPAPLPKAPAFLEGVVSYDGAAVPVVDLRKRLELPAPVDEETRIMVLAL